jgi:hypothetical protein
MTRVFKRIAIPAQPQEWLFFRRDDKNHFAGWSKKNILLKSLPMNTVQDSEWMPVAHSLLKRGCSSAEIYTELRDKGAPESQLQAIIDNVKDMHFTRKRKSGFLCCGVGVFLLVFGCLLTIFLYQSGGGIKFAMYGLTIIGVGFTIKGLVDLIGW